jgi:hypothetical protein
MDARCLNAPVLQIGDNSNAPAFSGHFVLTQMRYRRGAVRPGEPMPALLPRVPPPLPPRAGDPAWSAAGITPTAPALDSLVPFQLPSVTSSPELYDPGGAYRSLLAIAREGGTEALYTAAGNPDWRDPAANCQQLMRIRGVGRAADGRWTDNFRRSEARALVIDDTVGRGGTNITIYCPVGLSNTDQGITLDMRLAVDSAGGDDAFQFVYLDRHGQVSLLFSPTEVSMGQGTKPTGFVRRQIDVTTPRTYRLVRPADSRLFYLYIDGDPNPAITDFHPGADSPTGPQIQFGGLALQPLDRLAAEDRPAAHGRATIEFMRWQVGGGAP